MTTKKTPAKKVTPKATVKEEPKAFGYKVEIDHYCTDSEYSNEEWGSWSEDWSNEFRSIRRSNPVTDYPDAVAIEDFAPGEQVYVVWAEWSRGDSFGWANHGGVDALGVFRTWEQAEGLEKLARAATGYERVEYLGLKYGFGDFHGYFESLDDIHIESALMGA
jgi:hypothetical protein